MDYDLGVAASMERVAEREQFGDELLIVVDLAIEDHTNRAILVVQGLLPCRDVDD